MLSAKNTAFWQRNTVNHKSPESWRRDCGCVKNWLWFDRQKTVCKTVQSTFNNVRTSFVAVTWQKRTHCNGTLSQWENCSFTTEKCTTGAALVLKVWPTHPNSEWNQWFGGWFRAQSKNGTWNAPNRKALLNEDLEELLVWRKTSTNHVELHRKRRRIQSQWLGNMLHRRRLWENRWYDAVISRFEP